MEQHEDGGGGDVEMPRRGVGVRRRRHHESLRQRQVASSSSSSCEDGFGEGRSTGGRNKSWNDHGRFWRRGGGQARGSGGGKEGSGGRRPALAFVAQAVLSFVGMVVLPTRVAYEVLLQPRVFESHRGEPPPPPLSLAVRSDTGAAAAAGSSSGTLVTEGAREGGRRRRLSDFSRNGGGGGGSDGLISSKKAGWRGRRVLQTDDGDSFTYTSRTQFDLCAAPGSELEEDALRAGIMDVFEVEQEQTEGATGTVEKREVIEFCDDGSEEWTIAIGNEPSDTQSAAVISAGQMELVRSSEFTTLLAASLEDSNLSVDPAGLTYSSLGYIVLYDEDQAVTTANSNSLDSDFVAFRGPDQWWPWWAWLLFGLVLLCCICPLAACIYYYRPGHAGPPSPSGAGGGPGMFGGRTRGGTGKEIGKGGGGGNADWITQQYEKGGGGGGYGDKDFNDAATGISVYSPQEEVATSGSGVDSATAVQAAESPELASGEWPEAMESGVGMTGVTYTSTSRGGASTVASQQGDEATAVQSAEADRAAGVDPSRREHDTSTSALSMNPLVTSHSFNPAASGSGDGRVRGVHMGDSAASLESSRKSSEASWGASRKTVTPGDYGLLETAEEAEEGDSPAPLISGPSGRTLGSAAAALGGEDSQDEEGRIGSDSAFGGGGGGRAQSAVSYRTEDGSASVQSTSTLAALEAKAEAEAYEAELAASAPAPVSEVGTGSIDGPAAVVTATNANTAVPGLPPSGRSSSNSSSRMQSVDYQASRAARSRAASNSSSADELSQRDLTEEERQMRVEESEAARAASVLRGSSFKTPLQPDLERAIAVEEQERRRQAVQAVEASLAPDSGTGTAEPVDLGSPADLPAEAVPAAIAAAAAGDTEKEGEAAVSSSPAATGFMGKVVAGMGMSRFFGPRSPANTPSAAAAAAADGAEPTAELEATAAGDSKAVPSQHVAAAGAVTDVPPPEEAQAVDTGADADAEGESPAATGVLPPTDEGEGEGVLPPTDEGEGDGAPPAAIAAAAAVAAGAAAAIATAAAVAAGAAAAGVVDSCSSAGDADSDQKAGASSREEGRPEQVLPSPSEAGAAAAAAAVPAAALGPEEARAYSENVDRTLEGLPHDDGGASMPMSELLARAELEASTEHPTPTPTVPPLSAGAAAAATAAAAVLPLGASAAPAPSAAGPAAAPSTAARAGLPPPGPGQAAAAHALLQQSVAGSQSPSLDMARLLHNAEEGGMTLEEVEACLASPVVATPPALLRPGVGAARGGPGAPRSRGLLQRNSASGSYISSRSTSITEDMISNNLTEDDMSSDAQTTDVSRTSSFVATGSSFEENPAQSQAARNRFLAGGAGAGAGASASASTSDSVASGALPAAAGTNPPPGGGNPSSLAERLARAEETVGRDHEKGLLYRQGPEGVAAAVAGEVLPLPPGAAASLPRGIRGGAGTGGRSSMSGGGSSTGEKVESLADLLARADDGPGNLKETFRLLDDNEARRLEELNAAASAEDADDDTKTRWRGSLAELMLKVDRSGNLRDILDIGSDTSESASASDGKSASASDGNRGGAFSSETDSTSGSVAQTGQAAAPQARPE